MAIPDIPKIVISTMEERDIISPTIPFVIDVGLLAKYREIYNEIKGTCTEKKNIKRIMQYDRISALNLIQYKQAHKLPVYEGMVYVIGNKAWPNCYKIGMTVNVHERLRSYQTYSPYRDFTLEHYQFYSDRRAVESKIHKFLKPFALEGEWFNITNLEELKSFLKLEKAKEYNVLID